MNTIAITTTPFIDQKPGTSGLRKKTKVFMQENYLENFVQSTFNAIGGLKGKVLALGGDGRYYNSNAIQKIAKMALASGANKLIIGQNGLLSTPAASNIIRQYKADGGIILSASHNPGGIENDFGIKFNGKNGGPASETITEAIFERSKTISEYLTSDIEDIDLEAIGTQQIGGMEVEIIDPVEDYYQLMQKLFDFSAIQNLFERGFTIKFDAMHAVTGPYAKHILEDVLGAQEGSVINAVPSEDFGKGHPDPNPVWAKPLYDLMMSDDAPDFAAASDGDGDRNMILGRGIYVTPSDSLAVLAANAHLVPHYQKGISGVARSMPTSRAADRVADKLGVSLYETPTGWKFFGNLLDDDRITICGEESAGTGSSHVREKDGLWAVLLWLNILAVRKLSVAEILDEHWQTYGRDYYSRYDFEAVPTEKAGQFVERLKSKLGDLGGMPIGNTFIENATDFSYKDPVDGSESLSQGCVINFNNGARAVTRLSGTGTEGATIRLYLEQYADSLDDAKRDVQQVLKPIAEAFYQLTDFNRITGRNAPDVIT